MAKPKIKRFGNPDFLRKIKPESLLKLLLKFDPFFKARGISLKGSTLKPAQLDQLAALIVSPPSTCPGPLLDAVDMLDMLASTAGLDELRMVAGDLVRKVQETGDTAGDIALKVWLIDRHAIEQIYTKFSIDRGRTMKCYSPGKDHRPVAPVRAVCRAMEKDLEFDCSDLFDTPACEVMAFDDDDGHAFLIRHGEHVKRFEILDDDNKRDTKALRLLKHDVAFVYNSGEVLLSGRSEEVKESYRQVFSKHLFGDPKLLKPSKRFTLDPIRRGRDCLCGANLDMAAVPLLRELHMRRRGTSRMVILRCDDVFDEIEEHGSDYLRAFNLLRARVSIRVDGERKSPSVLISPEDDAIRGDIHHPVAKHWLDHCPFNLLSVHAQALANN
ncbi:MAG: hypothetical protein J0M04_05765 [Verrucomicrobia bacterium]|nr:hypothetical protein [Verrucomicrobiota bacterium]